MFSAKFFFKLLMFAVTVYVGIGAYSFAVDVAAKIAARAVY